MLLSSVQVYRSWLNNVGHVGTTCVVVVVCTAVVVLSVGAVVVATVVVSMQCGITSVFHRQPSV